MPRISQKTKQKRGMNRDSDKGPKRTNDEALLDQSAIYSMVQEGKKIPEIVSELGQLREYKLSESTVKRDLKSYRKALFALTENKEDFDKARKKELVKLDREEAMVMHIWERSLKPTIKREMGEVGGKFIDKRSFEEYEDGTIAEGVGDLACLSRLAEIRKNRQTLLSFDAYTNSEDVSVAIQTLLRAGFEVTRPKVEDGANS